MAAGWAARAGHTTVIDAAGAIYVIGGYNGTTFFNDVLVSTDGGAPPDYVRAVVGRYTGWVLRWYYGGYYRGTTGGCGVLEG
jgi:hypothetical protein